MPLGQTDEALRVQIDSSCSHSWSTYSTYSTRTTSPTTWTVTVGNVDVGCKQNRVP